MLEGVLVLVLVGVGIAIAILAAAVADVARQLRTHMPLPRPVREARYFHIPARYIIGGTFEVPGAPRDTRVDNIGYDIPPLKGRVDATAQL